MIKITNKKLCCGCTACSSICPSNCIQMKCDEEGFYYPIVDEEKCVNCGLCEKSCPVVHNTICFSNRFELKGYIVRDKRESILRDSTSGGFFTVLAEYVLSHNGLVYGAVFDDNFVVRHIRLTKESYNELERMRGSKYVQSDMGGMLKSVKQDLVSGKEVLFTGTPCQIAGLKSFLQKDYDHLITMDVVCHGTPSPLFWKRHIQYQENKHHSKISSIKMRNKTYGYHSGTMKIIFENGKHIYESARVNYYLKAFFGDLCSRPHCYNCSFKHVEHCCDFTVYDAWHASELAGITDDDRGWTNLIIQSIKGEKVFESIKNSFNYYSIDYRKAAEFDGSMVNNSVCWNRERENFFVNLQNENFEFHCKKYLTVSLKDKLIERLKKIYYWRKAGDR